MKISAELFRYNDIVYWSPKIGDVVIKDGMLFRWCAIVEGVDNDNIVIRKSGNFRLLVSGEHKQETLNSRKIKSSSIGSYIVISNNEYYI